MVARRTGGQGGLAPALHARYTAAAPMYVFLLLQLWFVLTACGYCLLVAKSSDGARLRWFPFPALERSHWALPVLKVIPTCLVLTLASFALDASAHWFVVSYLVFLVLMVIIDYTIIARPKQVMFLALAAHVLSEITVVSLVWTTRPGAALLGYYGGAAVLAALVTRRLEREGVEARYRWFMRAYAALLAVLIGSFVALAASPVPYPPLLRASFVGTALLVGATDTLWARREFTHRGTKLGIAATYYLAIWFIAMDLVLFAAWSRDGGW